MEESTKSNTNLILAAIVVAVILVVAAGGFVLVKNKENLPIENFESDNDSSQTTTQNNSTSPTLTPSNQTTTVSYKDGSYTATGSYSTPGGIEQVGVNLTLKSNVISSIDITQMGKSPTAKVKQADFAENYKPFVVGKNIDEVNLTVVSGSSLTTKGFNDALTQIKSKAKS